MPILLLEGLTGSERRRRHQVLLGPGGAATGLTIICVHLESILWISALILLAFLIPEQLPGLDLGAALLEESSAPYWISTLLYLGVISVMAPFYVAAGFALYIARRTELEAWDLELVFRRAAEAGARRPGAGSIAAGVALALVLALPHPAPALEMSREEARAEVAAVLDDEAFGRTREIQVWVPIAADTDEEGAELPAWLLELLRGLGQGAEATALVFKWAIILAAAVLVLLVLRRILAEVARRGGADIPATPPPADLRGLDARVRVELPADVPAAAEALLAAGDVRAAVALLYAASIRLLERRHGLEIPASATELECLALAEGAAGIPDTGLLRRLVRTWQRLAYAHRMPPPTELDALVQDWRRWQEAERAH
jgi:hypothetical protein